MPAATRVSGVARNYKPDSRPPAPAAIHISRETLKCSALRR